MRYRLDRSVESGNVPVVDDLRYPKDMSLYRCMVVESKFIDGDNNLTSGAVNPRVLYDVVVIGGFKSGQIISNCRLMKPMGSETSYYERTLKKTTFKLQETPLEQHDGEIVFVQFVQGDKSFPLIVGFDNAFQRVEAMDTLRADAPRLVKSFNGNSLEINNKGEISFTRTGGEVNEDGVFVPTEVEEEGKELVNLDLNEEFVKLTDPNMEILINNPEKTFRHTVSTEDTAYRELIDGTNEVTTRTYKSGLTVVEDGANDKVEITTAGGSRLLVDGSTDTVEVKDNATGKLKITGETVALGGQGIELLQQISDSLDKLIQWANTVGSQHVHIGNLGYPTAIPTQSAQYIQLGTDLQVIKTNVDQIKGSL